MQPLDIARCFPVWPMILCQYSLSDPTLDILFESCQEIQDSIKNEEVSKALIFHHFGMNHQFPDKVLETGNYWDHFTELRAQAAMPKPVQELRSPMMTASKFFSINDDGMRTLSPSAQVSPLFRAAKNRSLSSSSPITGESSTRSSSASKPD